MYLKITIDFWGVLYLDCTLDFQIWIHTPSRWQTAPKRPQAFSHMAFDKSISIGAYTCFGKQKFENLRLSKWAANNVNAQNIKTKTGIRTLMPGNRNISRIPS